MKKSGIGMVLGLALMASVHAADWPQFCGSNRNNISTETGLADSWSATGPKVLWETEVHDGYSGSSIKDGKVYLIDREATTACFAAWTLHPAGIFGGSPFPILVN